MPTYVFCPACGKKTWHEVLSLKNGILTVRCSHCEGEHQIREEELYAR